jgi:hypothetical protein
MNTPEATDTTDTNIYKLDIDRIKREACEIAELISQPDNDYDKIKEKYVAFVKVYPIIFRNIINKTMSIEEIHVLLDTFNTAQMHFINNTKHVK